MTKIDDIKHLLPSSCFLFFETLNLNALKLVLKNLKFLLSVEQVHDFAAINFEEAHMESTLPTPISLRKLIELLHCQLSNLGHRKGFP